MRKSRTLLAAALAGALTLGAAPALATVAYAEPGGQAPAAQENATVKIASAEDLANAIKNQAAGQTWNITNDITVAKPVEGNYEGQAGWAFPITADGITINGNGHTLKSTIDRENGAWATQNFMTVWGDNVTVSNLKIDCADVTNGINKAIEVLGTGFTISNVTILPGANGNSGSLYFNGAVGSATVKDVSLNSWISTGSVTGTPTITLDGVTIDFSGNPYADQSDTYFPVRSNVTVGEGGLTVKVDGAASDMQTIVDNLPSGTTLSLQSDIAMSETLNIENKSNFTLEGNGHTITASEGFAADEKGQVNLVKPENCSGITIKDVTIKTTSANKHALDVYGCNGLSLQNVTLDQSASGQGGAPLVNNGSKVTVDGALTLITGENSWYAANVDNGGSLVVNDENGGSVAFAGNSAKGTVFTEDENAVIDLGTSGEDLGNGIYGKAAAHIGEQGYLTLDAAVAAAQPGDTIELAAGEHEGNLVLNKALTIVGPEDGEAVISWNAGDAQAQKYLGSRDIYPTIFSTADLTLKNVTVAGPGPEGQHVQLDGVYVSGGNLTMDNVTVRDIRCTGDGNEICGVQTGLGVVFEGHGDLTITNSTIKDFNKQAIDASTDGAVRIENNTITGSGDQKIIAQNGIVLRGGTATISGNRISGLIYSADDEWAHGSAAIYVFGDTDATLTGNVILDSDFAIYVDEDATLEAKRNQILGRVYNYTENELDLSENYWGENPDFDALLPTNEGENRVSVFPRYADEAMTQLVDEQGNPVIETVTITFMLGDEVYKTVEVEKGSGIPANLIPADPVWEGHTFVGWYAQVNEDGTVVEDSKADLEKDSFGTDLTLYAGFVPEDAEEDTKPESKPEAPESKPADKNDALAQTSDPTSVAPLVATAVAGVGVVAGAVTLRRRNK